MHTPTVLTPLAQVKIGDFGFTKRLKRSKETVKVARITHPRWVAPEVGPQAPSGAAYYIAGELRVALCCHPVA